MACEPSTLSDSAKGFQNVSFKALLMYEVVALFGSGDFDPTTLVAESVCIACLSKKQLLAAWAILLCPT